MKQIISFTIMGFTMSFIPVFINWLINRASRNEGDDSHYIVKLPTAISSVCLLLVITGILLLFFFAFFWFKGDAGIKGGHFGVAVLTIIVGLIIWFLSIRWKIVVDDGTAMIKRLIGKNTVFNFADLDKVEFGSKAEITLYRNGKKIFRIDGLSDNYERFLADLKNYGLA